jgi:hypothetical protein
MGWFRLMVGGGCRLEGTEESGMGWDGVLGMMLVYRIVKTSLSLIISLNSRNLFWLSTHSEWTLRYLRELKMLKS